VFFISVFQGLEENRGRALSRRALPRSSLG
jgi:hypothetical protein